MMGISGDIDSPRSDPAASLPREPSREMRRMSPGNIVSGTSSEHSGEDDDTMVEGDWLLPLGHGKEPS